MREKKSTVKFSIPVPIGEPINNQFIFSENAIKSLCEKTKFVPLVDYNTYYNQDKTLGKEGIIGEVQKVEYNKETGCLDFECITNNFTFDFYCEHLPPGKQNGQYLLNDLSIKSAGFYFDNDLTESGQK